MDAALQDWDLLTKYREMGSKDAFGALVERYAGLVHAAARRRLGNIDVAEDVTQAVFIILASKARTIPSEMPLPAWLYILRVSSNETIAVGN
jgi:DNA-directed RNA polymerase specialized sigma24 family protein